MPRVMIKGTWHHNREVWAKGDVREVEDWLAEKLIRLGKARALTAEDLAAQAAAAPPEAPVPGDDMAAPEAAGDDGEDEEDGPRYKGGSVPAEDAATTRKGRARK